MSAPRTNQPLSLPKLVGKDICARILAIDYGRRRLGMALSDEMQLTARPLSILTRTNRSVDLHRIREICRENGVARIIVGNPLHMSGDMSEMAEEAARFAARLRRELKLDVELVDERLTSWEADQTVAASASRPKSEHNDDIAAAVLLREYLDRSHSRSPDGAARRD